MKQRGFTLLEMTVTLAIFSVIAVMAMAALFALISYDRKARNTTDVVTNLTFAIDSMARSIRTGTDYQCGTAADGNCWTSSQNTFSFCDEQKRSVTYVIRSDKSIGRCVTSNGCSSIPSCSPASSNAISMTDSRVEIQSMQFFVRGVGTTTQAVNILQPQVVFTIKGRMTPDAKSVPVEFTIQTTATQRFPDL